MPQLPQVTRERAIGMPNTGMSIRAVAVRCNAHFSTISRLRRRSNYLVRQLIDHMPTDHVWSHELRIGTSGFSTCAIVCDQRHRQLKKRLVWIIDESQDRPYKIVSGKVNSSSPGSWPGWFSSSKQTTMGQCTHSMDMARWRRVFRADSRQRVWRRVGERLADANVVRRVAFSMFSGGRVMVWAGISHGHRTQLHFIDGILNAVRYRDEIPRCDIAMRYRDEILRPIVVSFVHLHDVTLQQGNARPFVARICTQFLETEHAPVLTWPAMSMNSALPFKKSGKYSTGHNRQPGGVNEQAIYCTAIYIYI